MKKPRKVAPVSEKVISVTVYKARDGSRLKDSDAMIIGPVCEDLARRNGVARAEDLLSVARDAQHPTHRFFEWRDDVAAEAYRLDQARYLMRSYTVVIEKQDVAQEIRGLQFVDSKGGYVPTAVVFNDADMTREVIESAKKEAASWYHRHQRLRTLAELTGIFDAIEASIVASQIVASQAEKKPAA
jgi:hypothetical protein